MQPARHSFYPRAPGLSRRRFLQTLPVGLSLAGLTPGSLRAASPTPQIMTVRGPVRPGAVGFTLSHEHVLVDFIGAAQVSPSRYDVEEAYQTILPHLTRLRKLGGRTLVECTPAYLGRDPRLLVRLSRKSGLHILTNTGYYGAAGNKFLPEYAFRETAEQLAERWLREWRDGIEGTGVRPGFIKIGVEGERLTELHAKLAEAAARAHLGSGLTVASHTGSARLAEAQVDVLQRQGVGPGAFIFVHAQAEPEPEECVRLARRGVWISYDGFAAGDTERYVKFAERMRREGLIGQLLFSHDAGWYQPGEPGGGTFRPYADILTLLVPALLRAGLPPSDLREIFEKNPARAFGIRRRPV